jgi:hypothetical protein
MKYYITLNNGQHVEFTCPIYALILIKGSPGLEYSEIVELRK